MARDLVLDVITTTSGQGLKKAADGFDKLADKADAVSDALGEAGEKISEAGEKFEETAVEAGHLERQLDEARRKVKALAAEFDKAGDVDVLKEWRKASREAAGLERVFKSLGDSDDGGPGKVAKEAVDQLEKGAGRIRKAFGEAFDAMPKEVKIGVAVTLGGAAVAMGGAAATAGVLSALGLGGIAAGVSAALKDEKVNDAVSDLGDRIKDRIQEAGESAFAGPVIAATRVFDRELGKVAPAFERTMSKLAPMVEPLARGIAGFATKAVPGIEKAVTASKPFIDMLARALPKMGDALSSFMDSLSDGSRGGLRLFQIALSDISAIIKIVGNTIEISAKAFDLFATGASKAADVAAKATSWIPWVGDQVGKVNEGWQKMNANVEYSAGAAGTTGDVMTDALGRIAGGADSAAAAAKRLNAEFDSLFDQTMSVDQATIGYEAAVDALTESMRENGKSFSDSTEKGRENHGALLAVIQGAKDLRDANIAAGMGADEANAKYGAQIQALEGVLRKAHMTEQQIAALIAEYQKIPTQGKTMTVKLQYVVSGKQVLSNSSGQKVAAFAEGGTTPVNKPFLVGENGPELMQLGQHATVTPLTQGAGHRPAVGGHGGMPTARLLLDSAGSRLDDLLLEVLRTAVRTRGGDVQLVIGG